MQIGGALGSWVGLVLGVSTREKRILMVAGVAAGLFQFVFFWVLTLVYVRRANGEFDDINNEIVRAAWKDQK